MAVAEHRGRVMASDLHVVIVDPQPEQLDLALIQLEHLELLWSRFIETSDISRLNRSGGGTVLVDDETLVLLASMIQAGADTGGRFDPSVLPSLVDLGYAGSKEDPSARTVLSDGPYAGSIADVELDAERGAVRLPRGLVLDPGGIGKGLAADLVVAQLVEDGAAGALVSIGGDLVAAGVAPTPHGWTVGVEDPAMHDDLLCSLSFDGGGIATSSTRSRRWAHDGAEVHHLIDPRTRRMSATDLAQATVVATTGWAAEAHATAALLEGCDGVLDYLSERGLIGVAVGVDGTVLATDELRFARELANGGPR